MKTSLTRESPESQVSEITIVGVQIASAGAPALRQYRRNRATDPQSADGKHVMGAREGCIRFFDQCTGVRLFEVL